METSLGHFHDLRDESIFPLGQIAITLSALEVVSPTDAGFALLRHCRGDWGNVCMEDWRKNDLALEDEKLLFSVHESRSEEVFWVITNADRSGTTILLPSEY